MNKPNISVVVAGWHFDNDKFFEDLHREKDFCTTANIQYYVASHRKKEEIGDRQLDFLRQKGYEVVYFDNEGWDWGAFQQFSQWQQEHASFSDYYLFCHDDVDILKNGFLEAFLKKNNDGFQVIGNSVCTERKAEVNRLYPEDMLWAKLKGFDIQSDRWDVVRGSCFFTTKEVVQSIVSVMPVKYGKQIFQANRSLRIFGGLVADRYGKYAIDYLGETLRKSEYITEHLRGKAGFFSKENIKTILYPYINREIARRLLLWKRAPDLPRGMGLKLNLGSGDRSFKYYFNIDKYSQIADQNADIFELDFEDESIAEILMVHVIEHIDYEQVPELLQKFNQWLKPGGHLVLEFPDLIKSCKLILRRKRNFKKLQKSPLGVQGLFGGNPKHSVYDYHKWGWTKSNMKPLLIQAGFSRVIVERVRYHYSQRDTRLVAIK